MDGLKPTRLDPAALWPLAMDSLLANLLSPVVLAFCLGMVAQFVRSDLKFPEPLYAALSIYLLFAIGLKGGIELSKTTLDAVLLPAVATLGLGILTPIFCYFVLRKIGRLDRADSAAIASHYGSVSAVTFIAAQSFMQMRGLEVEGYMPALVAILEVPAIAVALMIAHIKINGQDSWAKALHEVLSGKSVVLLFGGLLVGLISGEARTESIRPFFIHGFMGALTLFLLEMGLVTAKRLRDLRKVGSFLVAFAIIIPIIQGFLGVWVGQLAGLSLGGSAVLGAMTASASYIAAPAAVRIALPQANPTFYLTAALAITFPFNLALGIPLYLSFARWLGG